MKDGGLGVLGGDLKEIGQLVTDQLLPPASMRLLVTTGQYAACYGERVKRVERAGFG